MENRAEREYVELEGAARGGAMIFGGGFLEGDLADSDSDSDDVREGGGGGSGEFVKGVRAW